MSTLGPYPDAGPHIRKLTGIIIRDRHRKDMGDLQALADSNADVGLLHPVVITPDNVLVSGERRLEAVKSLEWSEVPVHVVATLEGACRLLKAERDENTCRKDFTPSEAVAMGKSIEDVERAAAAERQKEAGRQQGAHGKEGGRGKKKTPSPKKGEGVSGGPPPHKRRTSAKVGAAVGMSGTNYEKAKKVVKAAEEDPQTFGPVVERMDRTGNVNTAYRTVRNTLAARVKRKLDGTQRGACPYPGMTLDEIKAYPVPHLAHDDCILWLWTTNAHMRDAFGVLDAWGFEQKTILTWVKDKMGTGDWLRGQTEHCLLAVRGKPTITLKSQTTVIHALLREHSRKPEEFYALVESLCPGSKVELFARTQREGWTAHGSDLGLFAEAAPDTGGQAR
jgi:N6-adenosine-specific RNA methylase IME4